MFENGTLFGKQIYDLMQCYQAKINKMKHVQTIIVPDIWYTRCLIRTLLMPQTSVWDRTHAEMQLFNNTSLV